MSHGQHGHETLAIPDQDSCRAEMGNLPNLRANPNHARLRGAQGTSEVTYNTLIGACGSTAEIVFPRAAGGKRLGRPNQKWNPCLASICPRRCFIFPVGLKGNLHLLQMCICSNGSWVFDQAGKGERGQRLVIFVQTPPACGLRLPSPRVGIPYGGPPVTSIP